MQSIGLVIFTVLGMTLIGGLSVTMYRALPAALLERAARHGRYAGLGVRNTGTDTAGRPGSTHLLTALDKRIVSALRG
jgi:hypothetical protein